MSENSSLDSLIEKYTSELIDMGARFNHPHSASGKEETADKSEEVSEILPDTEREYPEEQESPEENMYARESFTDETEFTEKVEEMDISEEEKEVPDPDPESFALFRASVFSANGAFPVENARVTVKKNGEIHAFLITNGSGETKTVKLESYPEENSLDPESKKQYMKYTADIRADGFESLSDLPVEAVGGSQILLQQSLIPSGGIV